MLLTSVSSGQAAASGDRLGIIRQLVAHVAGDINAIGRAGVVVGLALRFLGDPLAVDDFGLIAHCGRKVRGLLVFGYGVLPAFGTAGNLRLDVLRIGTHAGKALVAALANLDPGFGGLVLVGEAARRAAGILLFPPIRQFAFLPFPRIEVLGLCRRLLTVDIGLVKVCVALAVFAELGEERARSALPLAPVRRGSASREALPCRLSWPLPVFGRRGPCVLRPAPRPLAAPPLLPVRPDFRIMKFLPHRPSTAVPTVDFNSAAAAVLPAVGWYQAGFCWFAPWIASAAATLPKTAAF